MLAFPYVSLLCGGGSHHLPAVLEPTLRLPPNSAALLLETLPAPLPPPSSVMVWQVQKPMNGVP
jgi:hypothetical protein